VIASGGVIVAADYPFLLVLATMAVFFCFVAWLCVVVAIVSDVFHRPDLGGWGKAAWSAALLVLPFLGTFAYLVRHHDGMARRHSDREEADQRRVDAQVRSLLDRNAPDRTAPG